MLCVFGVVHTVATAFPQWFVPSTPCVHMVCGPLLAPSVRFGDTPPVMLRMLLDALGSRPPGTAALPPPPK